ncbi:TetR family transcriptional regulator [Streptacidiphilus jiangxiensis]|uniref:DNA-binding transcriptional regulator, AcrR family n=1 Tax=Streptacidiphilus jiangxiensis TaxID=235985 RepID=A0A1H7FJJ7_STRJI|nr:TetR family transcriptional regulator [Streptacidiphilus jiangxiensis]SEK26273.1 DNA-binding transcriptional regulator, AcrR family [Streptacidiphilus jiangxiensis]
MTSGNTPTPTRTTAGSELEELLAAPLGLRERKKLKTRRAIRSAAFGLFRTQGYEATTVDQIAAAAEVSPSTFFRYFPTKEDLVISDDYDPLMESGLRARPVGEPLVTSVREAMIGPLRQILAAERDEVLLRMQLYRDVPAIRARALVEMQRNSAVMCELMAERTGLPATGLELRALVAAVMAVSSETVQFWAEHGGEADLADLLADAFGAVARSFAQ